MSYLVYVSLIVFTAIELLAPRRPLKFFRKGFFEDCFYFVILEAFSPLASAFVMGLVIAPLRQHVPLLFDLSGLNFFFQFCIVFVITDFLRYWIHRAHHEFTFLWKIHQLHHSSEELTALSGHRNHPLEDITFPLFSTIPIVFLNFDPSLLLVLSAWNLVHGHFLHSNSRIRWPFVERFLAMPHFHIWHHAKEMHFRGGQNFGVALTIWDRIFKTLWIDNSLPPSLGLSEDEKYPRNVVQRLFLPILFLFKEHKTLK